MNSELERERLGDLFKNLEQLAASSPGSTPDSQPDPQELRGTLCENREQIQGKGNAHTEETNKPDVPQNGSYRRTSTPNLYEKEIVGFAFTEGRLVAVDDPSSILSDHSVLSTPLTIGSDVIGEIQIAPHPNQQLNDDQVLLTRAIAQQAALQIQNLKLLIQAERSRVEAEAATRRFVHEGWDAYLDAIQRYERIGYIYDRSSVTPHFDEVNYLGGVQIPVKVTDEEIGMVYVEPGPIGSLSDSDTALIKAVTNQVAQQVENIRLLADASRARAEAEKSMQQVARENWRNFTSIHEESANAFVYDSLQVTKQDASPLDTDLNFVTPLVVQGEIIGQLGITNSRGISHEDTRLATSLASQVSIHLETLRLNAELEKRAQELQELDRLKSAFLANMSHELRTPLNSILGFSEVMLEGLDGDLTENMNTDLRLIRKNGQHLLHLINDVLDMAKIESGRMNLHLEKFLLNDLLDEVISITSSLARERNNVIYVEDNSDRGMEIYSDYTRLCQVLLNLINNAIKFTMDGEITLRVSRLDETHIMITVKDTGIGIPKDHLEHIFQEFTQVDTSTTRKVGGTGLGLPISRRLVEMHGGRLWAESKGIEGEGSTFFVELPIVACVTEDIEKKHSW